MRLILLFLLVTPFYTLGNGCGGLDEQRCMVSVINLVATPERYHEKEVVVTGYVDTKSRGYYGQYWLSFSKDYFEPANMVKIDIPENFAEQLNITHHKVYSIVGVFESCNSKPPSDRDCFNSITPIIDINGFPSMRLVISD
ncbi:hypothetical protein [Arsukibacterium sp.]|uniref:hypothetical protein n=1 Tax=Arsukibacterium sp. TaxID=1977258 RepID=UPI00299CE9E5|nr:hypothetical protein [Arsukibacterium sp.]MDX1537597.1 hypothetical protein [Arsukibacterium sp.]